MLTFVRMESASRCLPRDMYFLRFLSFKAQGSFRFQSSTYSSCHHQTSGTSSQVCLIKTHSCLIEKLYLSSIFRGHVTTGASIALRASRDEATYRGFLQTGHIALIVIRDSSLRCQSLEVFISMVSSWAEDHSYPLPLPPLCWNQGLEAFQIRRHCAQRRPGHPRGKENFGRLSKL